MEYSNYNINILQSRIRSPSYDDDDDSSDDDGPLLPHRYDQEYVRPKRRSALSVIAKTFLFSISMLCFCILLYVPLYNSAKQQIPKSIVAGWGYDISRDTKLYVQPNNITFIHEPLEGCGSDIKLVIIVTSAVENFERRIAIRKSWGDHDLYAKSLETYNLVKNKYKGYNFSYDLYKELNSSRPKRDLRLSQLLPLLAKAYTGKNVTEDYDYDYSNVMKIPKKDEQNEYEETEFGSFFNSVDNDYKVLFLVGLPQNDSIQRLVDNEFDAFGDLIQESFIDSYNNLTLKSIMMLKWVTRQCNDNVQYILKTDDDMFINVPNLMVTLENLTLEHEAKVNNGYKGEDYSLVGDLICGAKPITNIKDKWYTPRYMFNGRVYPKYLSGTGYVLSVPAAKVLYKAALETPYFHLEDIFITGICPLLSHPPLKPRDAPAFWYFRPPHPHVCNAHTHATLHGVTPQLLRPFALNMTNLEDVDLCERMYLTQVRWDREKRKKALDKKENNNKKQKPRKNKCS